MILSYLPKFLLFMLVPLILFGSCKAQANSDRSLSEPEKPQIFFIICKMTKVTDRLRNLEILSAKITEGRLKPERLKNDQPTLGDLRITQFDHKGSVLETSYLPNPLPESLEYVDKDGLLRQAPNSLINQEFAIRIQLLSGTAKVRIERIGETGFDLNINIEKE